MMRDADILKIYEEPKADAKRLDEPSDVEKTGSSGNNLAGSTARSKSVDVVDLEKVHYLERF
ncbi:unnamed protein product [Cuscuta europaea]|uniref:Uncharacterized protein n=1 Tax=Cuscuta europaea TaxID=41803 RepID=A0A9P0Z0L5_CUSEU|nr:unnamed protein product [Cuscuta europaea]